jgi:hypothetical protein
VFKPGEDDLQSSTIFQAEAKVPGKDWVPLVGPVLAAFPVEKSSGGNCEQDALTQYLYWCKQAMLMMSQRTSCCIHQHYQTSSPGHRICEKLLAKSGDLTQVDPRHFLGHSSNH